MSTRANIIIQDRQNDEKKEYLYHHWDGYVEGVGRTLAGILNTTPKQQLHVMDKVELARWINKQDDSFEITTPTMAPDADYVYTIDLPNKRVEWYDQIGKEGGWLCDF